jgi:hypothetical protein
MNRPSCPCIKCEDRYSECHANCKPYKHFQDEQEIYRNFIQKQKCNKWIDHTASRDRRKRNGR